ncbi:ImmA/IrrE family metallo-endopeptidase [Priestia aryabhattai]|uniref:ImmA/IrrE family metallo-endopeptidase n=1 Tax=Priestia aryabhattai TaxID=412384 RepID=UPI001C8EA110|nr:ImmA/IrrE family metallo-endopeptidase [Priestia aryabhattai]MBY0214523.1 ImmA/IrrE family metallo-endopeptidase [Priestia aryabhattai]
MSKTYAKKSIEDKRKEVEELTNGMEKKVEQHFHSVEDLKDYLSFMGKFYQYSMLNSALIQKQFRGAQAVGSFKFWKDKGFSVNKGENGIKILVPNKTIPKFKDEKGKWKSINKATRQEKKLIQEGKKEVTQGQLYFSVGSTFDISQTNAKASDLPKIFPNRWLEGNVEDYTVLYKGMEAIAKKNGISIIAPKEELGSAKGACYPLTKEVALNPRNSERQNVKTILHELTHAKLHTTESRANYTNAEREFQAEMTAYTVSSYLGIDTSKYSLNYLSHWTKGKSFEDKTKLLKEVHETSVGFIETIEETLVKEREKNHSSEKKDEKQQQTNPLSSENKKGIINGQVQEPPLTFQERVELDNQMQFQTPTDTIQKKKEEQEIKRKGSLKSSLFYRPNTTLMEEYTMKKITSLSNDQFKALVSNKRELKKFMKHPQNEKIEADWANISEKQLEDIPSGSVYLTQSALGEEKPQVLLVSTDEKGQKQAYKSEATVDFLRSHDVNPVLEKDRETQLKTSYLTFLQAHEKEKPQDIDSMLVRVNAENDYVMLKSSALKEKQFTPDQLKGMENELSHQFQARKQSQEKEQYQEDYKQEVLEVMQQPSEETQYKQLFKQRLLAQLGISDEKDSSKEVKEEAKAEKAPIDKQLKQETPQEKEQRLAKMKEYEQKHSFDKVYKLKKEVLQELKELDLTDSQREKLTKLEKALDTEKKDHDKQKKEEKSQNGFTKFFARNNGAFSSKKRDQTQEMER